ncbi:hypothetical protein MMC15_000628 [Xylographa vitiligo]|nr:hypothetical protein [Xylographa vitiligo]
MSTMFKGWSTMHICGSATQKATQTNRCQVRKAGERGTRYASILEEFQKSSYLRGNETDSKDEAGTDNRDPDSDPEEDHAMVAHEENTEKVYEASALLKPQSTTIKTPVTSNDNSTMNSDESGDLAKTGDVVDRGIISMDTAMTLVAVHMTKLVQHFPAVILSENCTASELRVAKPVLFLAVVAAASLGGDSTLSLTLHKEIIRVYADQIVIKGEKSLELVQSLLVKVAYCYIPDSAAHLQFYQYSHMAVTMALEIGLGSKPRSSDHPSGRTQTSDHGSLSDGDTVSDNSLLEKCRALLACYAVTAGRVILHAILPY